MRTEYESFFQHEDFLMKGLHRMYLLIVLDLPKEMGLHLDLPPLPNCDNWGYVKLNYYVVNNTNSDSLQGFIHKDVCFSWRNK